MMNEWWLFFLLACWENQTQLLKFIWLLNQDELQSSICSYSHLLGLLFKVCDKCLTAKITLSFWLKLIDFSYGLGTRDSYLIKSLMIMCHVLLISKNVHPEIIVGFLTHFYWMSRAFISCHVGCCRAPTPNIHSGYTITSTYLVILPTVPLISVVNKLWLLTLATLNILNVLSSCCWSLTITSVN